MQEIEGKIAHLSVERPEKLTQIARALSSPLRIEVLKAISERSMNVGELAQKLDVPMSTMALAIRTLDEAGLIISDVQPGIHGSTKYCSRRLDTITISLYPESEQDAPMPLMFSMPIGGYSSAEGIKPTCGLLSETQPLGPLDLPRMFYSPERFKAQLLWFQQGFLEYRFSIIDSIGSKIDCLNLSFEACSEAPMYRANWPSDISVEINDKRLGTWTSPSDCGGRYGHLTPQWWGLANTQFGFLKSWRIDRTGSYLDHERISNVRIADLKLEESPYISVRIGIDPDSRHVNGINLFGDRFGDHPQAINLQIGFAL